MLNDPARRASSALRPGENFLLGQTSRELLDSLSVQDAAKISSTVELVVDFINIDKAPELSSKFYIVGDVVGKHGPVFLIDNDCKTHCKAIELTFSENGEVKNRRQV